LLIGDNVGALMADWRCAI